MSVRRPASAPAKASAALPPAFIAWFKARGWTPRPHQLALLDAAAHRRSTLLIAPTGAGKTLAGFLPSLVRLADGTRGKSGVGLRTLYISPLKALAADVARNLETPVSEMGLKIRIETRTGDTSVARKSRQRTHPPHILMTTPEQVALLLSHPDAKHLFANLDTIILDELHALAASKRGDLLALGIARLRQLAPDVMTIGLSATVAHPTELRAFLMEQRSPETCLALAGLVTVQGGAKPDIKIMDCAADVPWSGHTARYAMTEVYDAIRKSRLALIFVNTRMQAEYVFQELWRGNDDNLPIGLHHGSLDAAQRKKVEAAMAAGKLRAVVATSTLDLGIDWGDIDLVIHIGAPKGASRLRSASAAPTTASMSRRARSSCLEIASRFSNAAQRCKPLKRAARMPCCRALAHSTCSRSMFSAWPAPRPSSPMSYLTRSAQHCRLQASRARSLIA